MADDSDNSSNSTIIDAAQLAKEAAELKKAKAVRRTVRGSTTTIVNSLRQLKEEQVLRCDDIEEQLALLLIKEKALQQLDDKIYDLLDNADDDQLKVEFDSVENYKNSITLIQGQVSRVLRKAGIVLETAELTATSTASLNSQKELASSLFSAVSETRLPPLIIQKFDGDVTEWQGFWSQFGALMERKKLIKVERFGYLKSYLSGPALKIIKNMKPSDANYDEAVKMLKNRFGRDELISHTHMQKLLKLEPVSSSNDLVGLRRLYDECETNIRSLRSLGVDTAVNGTFLCPKLLGCLPRDI